jgi:hypothetical protein
MEAVARLPYDKKCTAITRTGRRCRARARSGSEFCAFHAPEMTTEQRQANAAKGGKSRRRQLSLMSRQLRSLSTPASVNRAMEKLYKEVRAGVISPEMGRTLLDIVMREAERQGGLNGKRSSDGADGDTRDNGQGESASAPSVQGGAGRDADATARSDWPRSLTEVDPATLDRPAPTKRRMSVVARATSSRSVTSH